MSPVYYFLIFFFLLTNCCCPKKVENQSNVQCASNKEIVCYTSGTFDMFHIGHLKLLENAKKRCGKLIVGVHPDEVVFKNKNKYPIIPLEQRMAIVQGNRYVDVVISESEYDFTVQKVKSLGANTVIIGDDYILKYKKLSEEMKQNCIDMFFLPYTKEQSSTKIRKSLKDNVK